MTKDITPRGKSLIIRNPIVTVEDVETRLFLEPPARLTAPWKRKAGKREIISSTSVVKRYEQLDFFPEYACVTE